MGASVIIPAYNEERRIAPVITAVLDAALVDEVWVVDDGSTDDTATAALSQGAQVLRLESNVGKGGAMAKGAGAARGDVLIFLDGDLVGLTGAHVDSLAGPLLSGEADMTVGIFAQGRPSTDWAQWVAPYLSGQRGIRREFLPPLEVLAQSRYGVEVFLNRHAREIGLRWLDVPLTDMTHVMKEEKLGWLNGMMERMKMYWEIVRWMR